MEEFLSQFFSQLHGGLLALVIVVSLAVLGKAADWLVDEAVTLSERSSQDGPEVNTLWVKNKIRRFS